MTMQRIMQTLGLDPENLHIDEIGEALMGGPLEDLVRTGPRGNNLEMAPFMLFMDEELTRAAFNINERLLEESDGHLETNGHWDVHARLLLRVAGPDVLEYMRMAVARLNCYAVAMMTSFMTDLCNRGDYPFRADEVFVGCVHRHNWRLAPRYTRPWQIVLIEKGEEERPSLLPYWRNIRPDSPEDHRKHPGTSYATQQVVWVDSAEPAHRMSVRDLVALLGAEGVSPFDSNIRLVIPAEVAGLHGEGDDLDLLNGNNDLSLDLWYVTVTTDAVHELCTKIHRIYHETNGSCGARRLRLDMNDEQEPTTWIVSNDHIEVRLADAAFLDAGGL